MGMRKPKRDMSVVVAWRPSTKMMTGPQQAEPPRRAGRMDATPAVLRVPHAFGWRNAVYENAMLIPTRPAITEPIAMFIGLTI